MDLLIVNTTEIKGNRAVLSAEARAKRTIELRTARLLKRYAVVQATVVDHRATKSLVTNHKGLSRSYEERAQASKNAFEWALEHEDDFKVVRADRLSARLQAQFLADEEQRRLQIEAATVVSAPVATLPIADRLTIFNAMKTCTWGQPAVSFDVHVDGEFVGESVEWLDNDDKLVADDCDNDLNPDVVEAAAAALGEDEDETSIVFYRKLSSALRAAA